MVFVFTKIPPQLAVFRLATSLDAVTLLKKTVNSSGINWLDNRLDRVVLPVNHFIFLQHENFIVLLALCYAVSWSNLLFEYTVI